MNIFKWFKKEQTKGLNFNKALNKAIKGHKIARSDYFDGVYVYVNKTGIFKIKTVNKRHANFVPLAGDVLSNDWMIIE